MQIIDLVQGTPEWLSHRFRHWNASDAPIIMGASDHTSRTDFLRMLHTGDEREYSEWAQKNLLESGHEVEARARPIVEKMLGGLLKPAVCVSGKYSASLDGLTADGTIIWECKKWNQELAKAVKAGELPAKNYWQLEHQLGVTKAERVFFTVTDGTPDKFEFLVYLPVDGRRKQLELGWGQFAQDLAAYTHVSSQPEAQGKAIAPLPALSIQLIGEVKASNLAAYKGAALAFIGAINTNLQTDDDFADAEKAVKFCDKAEKELELVKKQALGQTASIDDLFRAVDELRESMRQKRLTLEKLVKARKEDIRGEIRQAGDDALLAHRRTLEARLGVPMPDGIALFADVMRGKKTVSSLKDAVSTEVARVKIVMSEIAERMDANLKAIDKAGHAFLFGDRAILASKDPELVKFTIDNRLREHALSEEKRLEQERNKIRAEVTQEVKREIIRETAQESAPAPFLKSPSFDDDGVIQHRPTDFQIIEAVAKAFKVHFTVARGWLVSMELI